MSLVLGLRRIASRQAAWTGRRMNSTAAETRGIDVLGTKYTPDAWTNATPSILDKTGRNLLHHESHPLSILKTLIFNEFPTFAHYDTLSPVVTTQQNFDSLGFAEDHPGRARTDTYYLNVSHLLRTHTSAHQLQLLAAGHTNDKSVLVHAKNAQAAPNNERFLVAADVFRRDEIDASHYPVFHQMEGVCTLSHDDVQQLAPSTPDDIVDIGPENPVQPGHTAEDVHKVAAHMKRTMNRMVTRILTQATAAQRHAGSEATEFPVRWIPAYFPFTSPSWEMEVLFRGEWLEICGCGVMQQSILQNAHANDRIGWAFGFGLERLAMLLFSIPDIRLFWSTDPRFSNQFAPAQISPFRPFSKHPPCPKDVSFWISPDHSFHDNDLMDLVRDVAGDLAQDVKLVDEFVHPKTGRASRCYRINYCSMDRNVTHAEINDIQDRVRSRLVSEFGVTLR
ncbi:phenylalanyl-tRNA synthetase alpha subunit, mitochondrial [Coemansia sp. RSA 1972]|nr:phenylalanyl-tRNA synthetase alpha subunit, mitochondrial [Coemansia sp. RSA 1972]